MRRSPSGRSDRSQDADKALREFQAVGHRVVERRRESGTEVIEKQKQADDPQFALLKASPRPRSAAERACVEARSLLRHKQQRARQHCRRRGGDDEGSGVQGRGRRQPLHKLTADDGRSHRCGVEPEPLLIDEASAFAEPLAILDQTAPQTVLDIAIA